MAYIKNRISALATAIGLTATSAMAWVPLPLGVPGSYQGFPLDANGMKTLGLHPVTTATPAPSAANWANIDCQNRFSQWYPGISAVGADAASVKQLPCSNSAVGQCIQELCFTTEQALASYCTSQNMMTDPVNLDCDYIPNGLQSLQGTGNASVYCLQSATNGSIATGTTQSPLYQAQCKFLSVPGANSMPPAFTVYATGNSQINAEITSTAQSEMSKVGIWNPGQVFITTGGVSLPLP